MKCLAVILGVVVTGLVFIVEKLGPVFQVSNSLAGIMQGSFLGMFTIGMTSHTANTKVKILFIVISATREENY